MDLFNQLKNEVNKIREEKSISVPVTEEMIIELVKKTDRVSDLSVRIADNNIYVTGVTEINKSFIKKNVSFSLTLQPVKMSNRKLHFYIQEFKPLNFKFINQKLFNKPPYLTCEDSYVTIDFNSWTIVEKIPFGNIKDYKLTDGKIILSIGI